MFWVHLGEIQEWTWEPEKAYHNAIIDKPSLLPKGKNECKSRSKPGFQCYLIGLLGPPWESPYLGKSKNENTKQDYTLWIFQAFASGCQYTWFKSRNFSISFSVVSFLNFF